MDDSIMVDGHEGQLAWWTMSMNKWMDRHSRVAFVAKQVFLRIMKPVNKWVSNVGHTAFCRVWPWRSYF